MNPQPPKTPPPQTVASAEAPRRKKGRGKSAARRTAANMLAAIERGKTLDEVRDRLDGLTDADRNLADAMLQAALRHYGEIDAWLNDAMARPLKKSAHLARALLFIGAAQLLYMKVPPHAAVHETVAATGRREQPFRGLINAVLRKLQRQIEADGPPPAAPLLNLPDWLRERLQAAYGEAKTAAMATAHAAAPGLTLCFKNPKKAAAWAALHGADMIDGTHLKPTFSGPVTGLPDFAAGDWWVQDAAAGGPANILLAALADKTAWADAADVLDLCAAPGGKTLQLAAAGCRVTALDSSEPRLQRLRDNLARTGLAAETVAADALAWDTARAFDAVLLDAPCTATGTLRRHPDLALNRKAGDSARLVALQAALLDRAAAWVKPGGVLVYAVCSPDPAEGIEQAAAFLARHDNFVQQTPAGVAADFICGDHYLTTPDLRAADGGVDGFFAALLVKTAK